MNNSIKTREGRKVYMESFIKSHRRMCRQAFVNGFEWSKTLWNEQCRLLVMDMRYLHFYSTKTGDGDILHRIFCEFRKQSGGD